MELIRGVRPMTGQDIEQVADLEQVCFSESWSENLIRMGLDSRLDTYFVYADHGTILGYAVLRILADEGEIQRIGVYPHYRRQGIARKLMDAMVTFARARGVRAIALEVRESNLPVPACHPVPAHCPVHADALHPRPRTWPRLPVRPGTAGLQSPHVPQQRNHCQTPMP